MGTFKMAWRNVWRNSRRTSVTLAATTLALLVTILFSGLIEGYLSGMERKVLDLELGDLQIYAAGYRDKPSLYARIADPEALVRRLEQAGFAVSPRLLGGGLAAAGESSAGASLFGVEAARDARVSKIHAALSQGAWLDPADERGVVIGRRLARTLGVGPGGELLLLSQAADGSMANALYRVRGVLLGVSDGIDRGGVFLNAGAFRSLLVVPAGAHQLIVRRPARSDLASAAAAVRAAAPDLDVKTWRQLTPTLASYLDSARGTAYVSYFIVYIAIGILILNAMLMAVFERIREFGVLKALGMGPGAVLRLILCESALMTGLAIGAGTLLSLPGLRYLARTGIDMGAIGGTAVMGVAFDPVWRAQVSRATFAAPIALLIVVVCLAVLYPALKAALLRPVAAMTHR